MDRLVDHLFVFEGNGIINDYPGNYSQYRQSMLNKEEISGKNEEDDWKNNNEKKETNTKSDLLKPERKRQLSFKEKREFEMLEKEIAALTEEKIRITDKLNNSETPFIELQQLSLRIIELTIQLDEKEMRWLEISEMI